jgi:uncharacterized membrane protein
MLAPANFWMSVAGLVYLAIGIFILRKELAVARGLEKLITLNCVFIATSLAAFAPEHFRGPEFVKAMVPSYMPWQSFWAYLVGCALFAAGASLVARKLMRLSSAMLGFMFFMFVCMLYIPSVLRHPESRLAWTIFLRDLSFCAGAWAITGLLIRNSQPQLAKVLVLFSRVVLTVAALVFAVEHFLFPTFALGVPLELKQPAWVPLPMVWGYLAGAVLLVSGIFLVINKKPRMAAAWIGTVMLAATLFLYLPILLLARDAPAVNEGLNYVADTLLYAGSALAVAAALPDGA